MRLQHEDLEHGLGAGHPLAAAFHDALLEWPSLGRCLLLLALGGGLDGAVGCAFAAVDLVHQVSLYLCILLSRVKTYVAALLGDPDLLLDVVVAFAQLAVTVGTDKHVVLFRTPREAFWRSGRGFVGRWRRLWLVSFIA